MLTSLLKDILFSTVFKPDLFHYNTNENILLSN